MAKNAPGLLVGLSGTDSLLAFLLCAEAFRKLGKPDRVLGVHYGPQPGSPPIGRSKAMQAVIDDDPQYAMQWLSKNRCGYDRWIDQILSWLAQKEPDTTIRVESDFDTGDDYQRWARLFKTAVQGIPGICNTGNTGEYWVVGTRNATEQTLGSYSNVSSAVSLQPLRGLWKSEVLELCTYLDVPQVAMDKSREEDCGCGRYELASENIEDVDAILMVRGGFLSPDYLARTLNDELRRKLQNFVETQISETSFKSRIPYTPLPGLAVL